MGGSSVRRLGDCNVLDVSGHDNGGVLGGGWMVVEGYWGNVCGLGGRYFSGGQVGGGGGGYWFGLYF